MKYLVRAIVSPFLLIGYLFYFLYYHIFYILGETLYKIKDKIDEFEKVVGIILGTIVMCIFNIIGIPFFAILITNNFEYALLCVLTFFPSLIFSFLGFDRGNWHLVRDEVWEFELIIKIMFPEHKNKTRIDTDELTALRELDREFPGISEE